MSDEWMRAERKKQRFFFMVLLFFFICSSFICSSLIASPKDDLEQTQKDIDASKARQEQLAAQSKKIDAELQELQAKLVAIATTVQQSESDLSSSEDKLRILNEQLAAKEAQLEARRKSLASLVQAALRLSRTPPEAVVMMPGDTMQAMKAARALKMAQNSIKQEAASLGQQLTELAAIKEKVGQNHDDLAQRKLLLDASRGELTAKLAARKMLVESLGRRQQAEADRQAKLAQQAADLQDLVAALRTQEKEDKQHRTIELRPEEGMSGKKGRLRSFSGAKGHVRSPAAGEVVQSFGRSDGRNDTSKGIVIVTRDNAQVTSPYDGEVVFAGPFLTYGRLIIIRHSDDFHTLIAGLSKIDVVVGQFLLEGEPIGAMGDSKPGKRLYLELRQNNQPVDPAPWISGLK